MSLWQRIKRWFAAWRFKRRAKGMGFGPHFPDVCYLGWNRNRKKLGYMTVYSKSIGFYDFTAADVRKVELLQFADSWVKYKMVFTSGVIIFATFSLKCMFFFEWYFRDKIYRDAEDGDTVDYLGDDPTKGGVPTFTNISPEEPVREKKVLTPEERAARKKKIKKITLITVFSTVFTAIIVLVVLYFTAVLEFAFTENGIYKFYRDNGIKVTGCSQKSGDLVIPEKILGKSVKGIGYSAFAGSQISSVKIPDSVEYIDSSAFEYCSGLTSVTIPDSVTKIGSYAFRGCSGLTSITIPDSVTSIGECAFYNCSGLTSVTIPDSVTNIGSSAFSGCSSLTSISGSANVTKAIAKDCGSSSYTVTITSDTSIASDAFRGRTGLTSVTIPDSVTKIGSYAFRGCSGLTSVTIGNGVTNIGSYAFQGCSGLTSITFQGTKSQWNNISKYSSWNINTGNYTVHCTDGDIAK